MPTITVRVPLLYPGTVQKGCICLVRYTTYEVLRQTPQASADVPTTVIPPPSPRTTTTDKGYLNSLCGNRPHQGFVLKARPLEFVPILFLPPIEAADSKAIAISTDTITTEEKAGNAAGRGESGVDRVTVTTKGREPSAPEVPTAPALDTTQARAQVWVALDEVTDPQNFGALLRSAHFFGATGVVACAKNSASLTPVVSKASAGAAEVMRVHSTANMMRFLKRCKENGWRIVGTAVSESSVPLTELPAGPDAPPTVVVLGNEGYGVRASVLRECDVLVEVVGSGGGAADQGTATSTVDSLNVSVTGGIMLFHLLAAAGK